MKNIRTNIQYFLTVLFSLIVLVPSVVHADTVNPNAEVESKVRAFFADAPVMADIAKCETGFRQFRADGETLHDATGTYVGLFQIDERIHILAAWEQGFNLYTLEGNMGYAKYLYSKSGTRPWKGCVPKSTATIPITDSVNPATVEPMNRQTTSSSFTRNLRMGMSNSEVLLLQQTLNGNGFTIALTGPGSIGNETSMFGALTREAVRKFQCAKQIVCTGDEPTTGYGRIGPATRAALNTLSVTK